MEGAHRAKNIGSHLSISKEITEGQILSCLYCSLQYKLTLIRKDNRTRNVNFFHHLILVRLESH